MAENWDPRKFFKMLLIVYKRNTDEVLAGNSVKYIITSFYRDLLKACARINDLNDLSDPVAVFHELIDCWTVHCCRQEDVLTLSEIVANSFSLNHEQLIYQLNLRLPEILITQTSVKCGRVSLRRNRIAVAEER